MTENILKTNAFKLKGRLYTFTVIQIATTDPQSFAEHLKDVTAKAPKLFDNAPVVLDFSFLPEAEIDLKGFCQVLKAQSLLPVGVQSVNPSTSIKAISLGLALLNASSSNDKPIMEYQPEEIPTPNATKTKLVTTPVRSGQQVVSKGGDLAIVGPVSHGAELLADGHIHVYGVLRGRALAGISGDKHARIFCQALDAELLSIAGFYRLSDSIERHAGPCQIYLQDDHICIESL